VLNNPPPTTPLPQPASALKADLAIWAAASAD